MQIVKCPLCESGLRVIYRNETFEGWKRCNSCGQPSYIIAREESSASVRSLKAMIKNLKTKIMTSKALDYLMRKREASLSDICFETGMKVKDDLSFLEKFRVVMKIGNNYTINPGLEKFVLEEIQPYIPPKKDLFGNLVH